MCVTFVKSAVPAAPMRETFVKSALWERSGDLWGRSGELWGSSGEALGKLWEALETLWGRSREHRGEETKREQPRRDTESILIHQKICPPKLPIAHPWRPYWY